jgi:ketosteroid isomerase-like protein
MELAPYLDARPGGGSEAAAIFQCIEGRVQAVRVKDVERLMSQFAPDVRTFGLAPPLESAGLTVLRRRVTEWLGSFSTPIDYEIRDIELEVSGTLAYDHHLTHVAGKDHSGHPIDLWFRETVGWRKVSGTWKVTHQHASVPFDSASGIACVDLRPW